MNLRPALSALVLFACSSDPVVRPCATDSDCPGTTCIDERCVAVDSSTPDTGVEPDDSGADRGAPSLTSLRLEPETITLLAAPGDRPSTTFQLIGTLDSGAEVTLSEANFSLASNRIGDVDDDGVFSANGAAGGQTTVSASVDGFDGSASASVAVQIEFGDVGDIPADILLAFDDLVDDEARQAGILYPLDGAVMPQNVFPADVQWQNGAADDVFHIALRKPHVTIDVWTRAPDRHYLVDRTAWETLARSEPESPATVRVDRYDGTDAIRGAVRSVEFASAALTGTVYYWDIAAGEILRINDGTAEAEQFMPSPPYALRQSPGEGCVGCHTVSNSGRYMAGRLGGGENIGGVFDLTSDLTGAEPPTEFPLIRSEPTSARWWFSSWSPDDTRLAISTDEGASRAMRLLDPFSGMDVSFTGTAPANITHPAWSPDGSQIAYVTNVDTWGGRYVQGDIGVVDISGDAFGESRVLHTGASLSGGPTGGVADSYPTWSPDSARIAFSHGTGTRSEDQNATLYMMERDGSSVVRLARASGESTTDFQPRFSPFEGGGYFWLSFLSRRDYGNNAVGTQGAGLQQIWVTAVRTDAAAGEDGSSVPYWLPGQRTTTRNISAYWAPRPCRTDGESCGVGSECCGGDCRPDADGALVCSPPPPERCRRVNDTCSTDADCCEGLSCNERVCVPPIL